MLKMSKTNLTNDEDNKIVMKKVTFGGKFEC